jgi:hypothetical protein
MVLVIVLENSSTSTSTSRKILRMERLEYPKSATSKAAG